MDHQHNTPSPWTIDLHSDRSIRMAWSDPEALTLGGVRRSAAALREAFAHEARPEIIPAARSIMVRLDPGWLAHHADEAEALLERCRRRVRAALSEQHAGPDNPPRTITIPVRYAGEHGPDLGSVAEHCGLTPEQVIERHAGGDYRVGFIGFSPGFGYLLGLPPELATPRLPSPRTRVPAGSVGIAGLQTGVYPHATPGGWRIIGRTTSVMFDKHRDPPSLLNAGDRVRFVVDSAG